MRLNEYEIKHLKTIYEHIGECLVLLKKNGDFPLDGPCKIALYGNGARQTIKGGTGSGEVNSRFFINCEEGLKQCGFEITSTKWLNEYDLIRNLMKLDFIKAIKRSAREHRINVISEAMGKVMVEGEYELPIDAEGDVAVYVLSRISGEGDDRTNEKGDFLPTDSEIRDLKIIKEKYQKVLLVLNCGGPIDLSELSFIDNILVLSQLGVETGKVLGDFLLGNIYPSGKLATTYDSYDNYAKIGDFRNINDTHYKEGIYVGYRYFDSVGKKALYPFGYGLSFADFSYKVKDVSVDKDIVKVISEVENVSDKFKGKEVVQIYVSKPQGKLDKPYQDLVAFKKTGELKPHEKETIEISFSFKELTSYDEETHSYVLEKGSYILRVGNSSVDTYVAAELILEEDKIIRVVKNCLGDPGFKDFVPERRDVEIPEGTRKIRVDLSQIETEYVNYDVEDKIDERLKDVDEDELIYLNIGAFDPHPSITSMIGSASTSVAGAAGESTSLFKDRGLKNIVMADGPAGLRLSKNYYIDKKGNPRGLNYIILGSTMDVLPKIAQWFISLTNRTPKNVLIKEQFATAIPIGTAIAQSFNPDFAIQLGDIVGKEMELFNVDLWLAPALNIHRDVLCGRNFEYFSEDPLVSGIMAASLCKGVQAHSGKGATIKHYAANNQETNRYGNNSCVSERAMREIYLKGFEICIKEVQPYAVMSSYNLLNGTHTSEHQGLCIDILRREFGFDNILMTDWVTVHNGLAKDCIYSNPDAAKVAAAGHSLFMPGCKRDFGQMKNGIKNRELSRKQLRINGSRLYKVYGK